MELESLKGLSFPGRNTAINEARAAAKKSSANNIRQPSPSASKLGSATVGATTVASGGSVSTTGKPITYVKKPGKFTAMRHHQTML